MAPFYLGEVFLHKREFSRAKSLLLKGNKRSNGSYRHILYQVGQLHVEMKDYASAVEVFEKIVKLDTQYKDVQTLLKRARKLIKQ